MKKLSKTLKELGIDFTFPIMIKDLNGYDTYYESRYGYWKRKEYDKNSNLTYFEDESGYWQRKEYDKNGIVTYFENSCDDWFRIEYDENGNETYYEDSDGKIRGTKRQSCDGKVITVDGKKYKLTEL